MSKGQLIVLIIGLAVVAVIVSGGDQWWPFVVFLGVGWVLRRGYEDNLDRVRREKDEAAASEEEKRQRDRLARDRAQALQHDLDRAVEGLKNIVDRASNAMRDIPKQLEEAEHSLVSADQAFSKRSFYPFWDHIADAVAYLTSYRNHVDRLQSARADYVRRLAELVSMPGAGKEHRPPDFPASSSSLPALQDGSVTAERIDALYDRAHQDFEFSNIYANWRTNKTLVAGFDNLSQGLHAIRDDLMNIDFTLRDGFDSVNASVRDASERMSDAMNDQTDSLNAAFGDLGNNFSSAFETVNARMDSHRHEQSQNEAEMIDLLDNIQRGRVRLDNIDDVIKHTSTRPL